MGARAQRYTWLRKGSSRLKQGVYKDIQGNWGIRVFENERPCGGGP